MALDHYRLRFEEEGQEPDAMITSAGDYPNTPLGPAHRRLRWQRGALLAASAACAAAAGVLLWLDYRDWRAARAAAAGGGGGGGGKGGGGAASSRAAAAVSRGS